jgi:hypothetical protein
MSPTVGIRLCRLTRTRGEGGDVHYVTVEQGPDQSPEGCVSALSNEGKPRFIH